MTRGATSSRSTEESLPTSSGPSSRRLPAKRPQVTIEISSDPPGPESDEHEAGPSSRPAKRPKPASTVPQRGQLSSADVDFDAYVPAPEDLKEEISPRPRHMLYQNYDSYNREKVQEAIQGMRVDLERSGFAANWWYSTFGRRPFQPTQKVRIPGSGPVLPETPATQSGRSTQGCTR